VSFPNESGRSRRVVDDVSLTIQPGQTVAIVGESGSGKSVTALSVLRLLPAAARIESGRVDFAGHNLLELPERKMRRVRGGQIAMIFQEPVASLNPVYTVGDQIIEAIMLHQRVSHRQARQSAIEALDVVRIANPEQRLRAYPHELSGGMCQRVMIAMAIACQPKLLIADEPTTALDVTIQKQILELLRDLQRRRDMAIMLISHDLGVVAENADHVCVMYAGRIVESAPVDVLFNNPLHPYTRGLLAAIPRLGERRERLKTIADVLGHDRASHSIIIAGEKRTPWWPESSAEHTAENARQRRAVMHKAEADHRIACQPDESTTDPKQVVSY